MWSRSQNRESLGQLGKTQVVSRHSAASRIGAGGLCRSTGWGRADRAGVQLRPGQRHRERLERGHLLDRPGCAGTLEDLAGSELR
jgi:hypothetical protein